MDFRVRAKEDSKTIKSAEQAVSQEKLVHL
ncbi:MAG: hypothetical protein ACI9MF_002014 [Gammaproteobacteria bacterium]